MPLKKSVRNVRYCFKPQTDSSFHDRKEQQQQKQYNKLIKQGGTGKRGTKTKLGPTASNGARNKYLMKIYYDNPSTHPNPTLVTFAHVLPEGLLVELRSPCTVALLCRKAIPSVKYLTICRACPSRSGCSDFFNAVRISSLREQFHDQIKAFWR